MLPLIGMGRRRWSNWRCPWTREVLGWINSTQPCELFLKNFSVLNSIAIHFQFYWQGRHHIEAHKILETWIQHVGTCNVSLYLKSVLRQHVQHQTLDPQLVTLPKLKSECANHRQSARRPCSLWRVESRHLDTVEFYWLISYSRKTKSLTIGPLKQDGNFWTELPLRLSDASWVFANTWIRFVKMYQVELVNPGPLLFGLKLHLPNLLLPLPKLWWLISKEPNITKTCRAQFGCERSPYIWNGEQKVPVGRLPLTLVKNFRNLVTRYTFTEKQASADKDQRWTPCIYTKLHKLNSLQLSYQIYTGSTTPIFFMCQLLHRWSHHPSL
jgi:hypothetical protein